MKKFKDLSLRVRLPLMIGMAGFFALAIVFIILMFPLRSANMATSAEIVRLQALASSKYLTEEVNSMASVARSVAGTVEKIAVSKIIPNDKRREMVLEEMEGILEKDNQLSNIWCVIEPDALDSLDSYFALHPLGTSNVSFSNADGTFIAWFIDNEWHEPLNPHSSDFYIKTKNEGKERLSEPYYDEVNGKKVHMLSLCVPLKAGGRFIGEVGVDFKVEDLSRILMKGLDQDTKGQLITSGDHIAVCQDEGVIGKTAKTDPDIFSRVMNGQSVEGFYPAEEGEIYRVYIPVRLGENDKPWIYVVDVASGVIYASSNMASRFMAGFNLFGILLIMAAVWFVTRKITSRITGLTNSIHHMSYGRMDIALDSNQNQDELGQMNSKLGQFIDGLRMKTDFAKRIGAGDYASDYSALGKDDELGNALVDMRNNLYKASQERKSHKTEEEKRNWANTGIARFAEILRQNNDNMEQLTYHIISNLVKYMNANQGGIFILNEDDHEHFLELTACYAYDRKKYLKKNILPGEGLVGSCYLEGESIYMTNIPDNYISITSGLGDDNPRALFIGPLKLNGVIYGIIEIASFTPFEQHQLEFLERINESIAGTISSVRVNIRTERLLAKTQLQAEEMANQEEELRQNMEEMQSTHEEMLRRETELKELRQASEDKEYEMSQLNGNILKKLNAVGFTKEGVLESVSDSILEMLNVTREDFIGKSFIDTYPGEKEEGTAAWKKLLECEQVTTYVKLEGIPARLECMPVVDRAGNLKRVVTFVIING